MPLGVPKIRPPGPSLQSRNMAMNCGILASDNPGSRGGSSFHRTRTTLMPAMGRIIEDGRRARVTEARIRLRVSVQGTATARLSRSGKKLAAGINKKKLRYNTASQPMAKHRPTALSRTGRRHRAVR